MVEKLGEVRHFNFIEQTLSEQDKTYLVGLWMM